MYGQGELKTQLCTLNEGERGHQFDRETDECDPFSYYFR